MVTWDLSSVFNEVLFLRVRYPYLHRLAIVDLPYPVPFVIVKAARNASDIISLVPIHLELEVFPGLVQCVGLVTSFMVESSVIAAFKLVAPISEKNVFCFYTCYKTMIRTIKEDAISWVVGEIMFPEAVFIGGLVIPATKRPDSVMMAFTVVALHVDQSLAFGTLEI